MWGGKERRMRDQGGRRKKEKKFAYIQKIAYLCTSASKILHKIFPEVHAMHLQDNTTMIPTSQDLAQPIKTFLGGSHVWLPSNPNSMCSWEYLPVGECLAAIPRTERTLSAIDKVRAHYQ